MIRAAVFLAFALALAGCGSSGESTEENVRSSYLRLEKLLTNGDAAACEAMSGEYQNKLAASVRLFASDCPAVVKEVGKGLRADPELRTRSIEKVKVSGSAATLIAHSTYGGDDVRTKVNLKQGADGGWRVDGDQQLDDVAPSAPLTAYRDYTRALRKGDGEKACALATSRGQDLMARTFSQSDDRDACEGAIPFLAVAASKLPEADVVGGAVKGDAAALYVLQSDGNGVWVSRAVGMAREDGKWLFDYSRDIGRAPAPRAPSGPVT